MTRTGIAIVFLLSGISFHLKGFDLWMNKSDIISSGSISSHIPEGYELLDSASGNLNNDAFTDVILVLKKHGEDAITVAEEESIKRPVLILTGNPDATYRMDATYRLAVSNENVVYCLRCGGMMGDPFISVSAGAGTFSFEHYGGSALRWSRTLTFTFSEEDKGWILQSDKSESFHATDPEAITITEKSEKDFGKIRFEEFDIYN